MLNTKLREYIDSIVIAEKLSDDPNFNVLRNKKSIYIDKLLENRYGISFLHIYKSERTYYINESSKDGNKVIFRGSNVNDLIERLKELLVDES